jgi:hypothetical protein
MMLSDLRAALNRKPFIPFRLYFADGSDAYVGGRDFLLLPPAGSTVIVYEVRRMPHPNEALIASYQRTDADFMQITKLVYATEPSDQLTASEAV